MNITEQNQGEIKLRVRAGMALLDEERPGWRDAINLDELDLQSCYKCILGQVFNEFMTGCSILGIEGEAYSYGFDVDWQVTVEWNDVEVSDEMQEEVIWNAYKETWVQEISCGGGE